MAAAGDRFGRGQRWIYSGCQPRTGADKLWYNGGVRIAALSPSIRKDSKAEQLHTRAVKLSKPPYRDV